MVHIKNTNWCGDEAKYNNLHKNCIAFMICNAITNQAFTSSAPPRFLLLDLEKKHI